VFMVVGLGNPGKRYRCTRHNAGFRVVDQLASLYNWGWKKGKRYMWTEGMVNGRQVVLFKPLTYMNLSGEAVSDFLRQRKAPEQIVVVHDEVDLPPGAMVIKRGGGIAGHRGLNSLVFFLETEDFYRVRIGIGRSAERERMIEHVLGIPRGEEAEYMKEAEDLALRAVEGIIKEGADCAMNRFNRRRPSKPEGKSAGSSLVREKTCAKGIQCRKTT